MSMQLRSNRRVNDGVDWRKIHITGENIHNGNVAKHREKNWNFQHLRHAVQQLLDDNPDSDLYMFGSSQACDSSVAYQKGGYGNQAPTIVIVQVPSGMSSVCICSYVCWFALLSPL